MVVKKASSPLIVVSNRLPFVLSYNENGVLERNPNAGGLVTAVAPVVISCKGLWIGWSGLYDLPPGTKIPESKPTDRAPSSGLKSSQIIPVEFDKDVFDAFYNGCCNGSLWPLFHSMPDRAVFRIDTWKAYCKANEEFARKTLIALRMTLNRSLKNKNVGSTKIPIVWIHDYQLFTAASYIRKASISENLSCKIGFFLHIPFPSWDIMRLFPWNEAILQGMLACDLIGFHVEDYCLNFLDCCMRILGCKIDRMEMTVGYEGRVVEVKAHPIGVPFERFGQLAKSSKVFVKDTDKVKVILGVDRLDYTKGLVNRILAFEKLLEKHPEYKENITFLQVSVPSRTDVMEYKLLKEEIDQLIGRINGRFSKPNWSPIRYIYDFVNQEELAALYRDSAVALVTPLRDGMNLVAKEFVACQVNEPGVLVLSQFAGAGVTMQEALLVNPYEIENVADTINNALKMSLEERQLRMSCLRNREEQRDVTYWMNSFLHSMSLIGTKEGNNNSILNTNENVLDLFSFIGVKNKLCFILDYDGTLASYASHPSLAVLPAETRDILARLSEVSGVHIAIITGRSPNDIAEMVNIKNITYAGCHGLEILHPDGTKFEHPVSEDFAERLRNLARELEKTTCTDGAWVENKGIALTFHYRETPQHLRDIIAYKAIEIFQKHGFQPRLCNLSLEVRLSVKWDQVKATTHILRTTFGYDWERRVKVMYAGNEEDLKALKDIAFTICVDPSSSSPNQKYVLSGPDSVLEMLKWLEKYVSARSEPSEIIEFPLSSKSSDGLVNIRPFKDSISINSDKLISHNIINSRISA